MGKPMIGPDMQDVLLYLTTLQDESDRRVSVLLESDGCGIGPRWRMSAWTSPGGIVQLGINREVGVTLRWPHRDYRTFEGAFLALLMKLEEEWAKAYLQEQLDIT